MNTEVKSTDFNIFDFKKRLQTMVGQSPDGYRMVEIVGDACAKLVEEGLDPRECAMALETAGYQIFDDATQDLEALRQFFEDREEGARKARKITENTMDKYDIEWR